LAEILCTVVIDQQAAVIRWAEEAIQPAARAASAALVATAIHT